MSLPTPRFSLVLLAAISAVLLVNPFGTARAIAGLTSGLSSSTGRQSAAFVVTSTGDQPDAVIDGQCATVSGECTLRAALQEANAQPGPDTVSFAIDSGVQTIVVGSPLPAITEGLLLDGWTQPGFVASPLIVLNGQGVAGSGLTVTGGQTMLRGLVVQNFTGNGILLSGAGGNVIEGCYVGTDVTGATGAGNGQSGILIDNSADNLIGGLTPVSRNLISGNLGLGNNGGVMISGNGASGNRIQGNYIGTDITGMNYLSNQGRGVAISGAPNNIVGGPEPGARNLISGNRATGVRILGNGAEGNVVEGNWVGTTATGGFGLGNDRGLQTRTSHNSFIRNRVIGNRNDGVALVSGATENLVEGNLIAYNGYGPHSDPVEAGFSGIYMLSGSENTFRSNRIFGNAILGIELFLDGVTPNDPGDLDDGPNRFQNYPVIASATRSGSSVDLVGNLNSQANATYTVEFFANPSCGITGFGQGRYPLGLYTLTTDGNGDAAFSINVGFGVPIGWFITATATDAAGNTSEFSACVTVQ